MLARVPYEEDSIVPVKAFDEFVHLARGGERGFVEHVQGLRARVLLFTACKVPLQGRSFNSRLGQFLRRAGGGRKPFDAIAFCLGAFADHSQRCRLTRASHTLQPDELLARKEDFIDSSELRGIQFQMPILNSDS